MIPERTKEALDRYVTGHVVTGSFLRSVLANDLVQALHRADDDNLAALPEIVQYVYWELPGDCWGTPEKVSAWLVGEQSRRAG